MEDDELLFKGLRVLDVGTWIAAPTAATILADLGADVVKIEQPLVGDAYRNYAIFPFTPTAEANYTWTLDARNKRSLALNLKTEQGMGILKRMVSHCDVYITNQPLPMRRELGLDYEHLKDLNERMIYASLTAYGEEGPDRDWEGFDLVAYWSRSGLMDRMRDREAGHEPRQALAGMGDHPSGVSLYASIVTALLKRERTGKGTRVHTSLLHNGIWSASCLAQAAFAKADFDTMPATQRMTSALYPAKDGRWIQMTMIRTAEDFDRLMVCLDSIELLTDARFLTPESRIEHADEFTELLKNIISQKDSAEWVEIFKAADVPAVRVGELSDLPTDPQVLLNNMAVVPIEDVGMERVIRDPLNIDGVGRVGVKKPPELGQHSIELLEEMGFSQEEIDDMQANGVI